MRGRCALEMPQPSWVAVMVERENVDNARKLLVNYSCVSVFFLGIFLKGDLTEYLLRICSRPLTDNINVFC